MLESLINNPTEQAQAFGLVAARLIGFVVFLPLFGMGTLPIRFRVLFALLVAVAIFPACDSMVVIQSSDAGYVVSVVQELILGLALGTGVQLIFGGLDVAGKLMGELSGLSIVRSYDASALSTEAPQAFLKGLAGCMFLAFGGHRVLIGGIMDSMTSLPPGNTHFSANITELLMSILSQSFFFGVRVAAPAVLAMLVASLTVGVVSRSVPQLSSFTVGMGLNAILLFAVLLISLGTVGWVFEDFVEQAAAELFAAV